MMFSSQILPDPDGPVYYGTVGSAAPAFPFR